MKKLKYYLTVSTEETRVILRSLIELKNKLIREGRHTGLRGRTYHQD